MNHKTSIIVSGASGFIGTYLVPILSSTYKIYTISHNTYEDDEKRIGNSRYAIHLAGLAHKKNFSMGELYKANVEYTQKFLKTCKEKNVEQIIYISSLKVLGEGKEKAYTERSNPNPEDDYARTKLQAEDEIKKFAHLNGIIYTIIRPPIIYGPNPKANILSLIQHIQKGLPLPISSQENKRSFLSLKNLSSFILKLLNDPISHNQTFLIQDPVPLSTKQFSNLIASALSKKLTIVPIPFSIGHIFFNLIGLGSYWKRMNGSLYVDDKYTRDILIWSPPITTQVGVKEMVDSIKNNVKQ